MAVSGWVIGDVYADPCRWSSTLLDPPPVSSVDALVTALAGQKGLRVSTPTDITVDGFAGTSMERTVPAGTTLAECDGVQFRPWLDTNGENGTSSPVSATCCGSSTSAAFHS